MKKFSKIFSLTLTIALLCSLLVAAVPAGAAPLEWANAGGMPSVNSATNNEIRTGSDVSDMAVAGDNSVIWAIDAAGANAYVSTDGGKKWTQKVAATTKVTAPTAVALAPDDPNFIVIAGAGEVAVSTNGGTSFTLLTGHTAGTINDVAVSPTSGGVHYIAIAGTNGSPVLDYFNYGSAIPAWSNAAVTAGSWNATAMDGASAVNAIAFSPAFASDLIITAVTSTAAGATYFEIASFSSKRWNDDLGFTDYDGAANVLHAAGAAGLTNADISLYPTYLGADDQERRGFVTVAGTNGGLYRMSDATPTAISTSTITSARSVAYDGTNLLVGAAASNVVWSSSNPTANSPTITSTNVYQRPGGQALVVVAWDGATALAGTTGNESAFAVSSDNGVSFNDISLIDTALTNVTDFQQTMDGGTRFMVTNDSGDISVWKKVSRWERIYSQIAPSVTPDIIRLAPGGAEHVYVADLSGQTMLYSNDGGETKWSIRSMPATPVDLAVESNEIAYLLAANGNVYKTTNAGFIWGAPRTTGLTGGATIISLGTDLVLAGGTAGSVAWSTDGSASSTTWTDSGVTAFTGAVQVAASGLADGDFIYAGDGDTGNIRRRELGTTSWTDIITGTTTGGVTGIGLADGVLYAISTDGTDTYLYRNLSPNTSKDTTVWDSVMDAGKVADRMPSSLTITQGSHNIWVIDTFADPDKVRTFEDTLYEAGPAQNLPGNAEIIQVNPVSGRAYEVILTWNRSSEATEYRYQLSYDNSFTQLLVNSTVTSSAPTVVQVVGPYTTNLELNPGRVFYWRVKAISPVSSPYSEVRSFSIEELQAAPEAFEVDSPARGANNVSIMPLLTWTPYDGALRYELALSEDPSFAIVEWVRNVNNNFYDIEDELKYGTTYYWRVRAVTAEAPAATSDWANGVFQTMPEPTIPTATTVPTVTAPPTTVTVPGTPTVVEVPTPSAIPAYLLWLVIIIGAILVVALIVLIVRTRRVA